VDEGVQADDGVEGGRRELDPGGVGMEEPGGGDELAGPLDLHGAEVDAGDRVPAGGQVPGERHPTTASQIEDGRAGRNPLPKLPQPGGVPRWFLGIAPVGVGQGVITTPDDLPGGLHGPRLPRPGR